MNLRSSPFSRHWNFLFRLGGLALLAALTLALALALVDPVNYPNSDFFSFWLAGRLILQGESPYNERIWIEDHYRYNATWISDPTFLYPLPVGLLFVPLGSLPLYPAYVLWAWITQWLILASLWLLLQLWPAALVRPYLPLLGLMLLLFRPAWLVVAHGQLSGIVLFGMALTTYFWAKGRYPLGALFLPLALVKPNLGGPLVLLLLGRRLLAKDFKSLAAFLLTSLLALVGSVLVRPDWPMEFLAIGSNKMLQAFGASPTLWGLATLVCDFRLECVPWLGGGLVVLLLLVFFLWLRKTNDHLTPAQFTSLAICLTLLVTPYTWTYDHVLLLFPLVSGALLLAERRKAFLFIALVLLGVDGLAFLLFLPALAMGYEMIYALLPLTVTALFLAITWQQGRWLNPIGKTD